MTPPVAVSAPARPLRRLFIILGVIGAIWLVAASRWIFTDTVVPWDSKNQFYAFFRFLAQALNDGSLPFWNPYHYGGHPSVADPQSLIFAPAFFLWALFDGAPSLRTFDLIVYAHLLAGGIGVALIGWRAKWPAAVCIFAAALFMLGGTASGRLQHTGIIISYGLFPIALLLLQVAMQRRSYVSALAFAFVAAVLALGRNQVALLLCYALIAVAVAEVVMAPQPLAYLRSRWPILATMAIAGFALIALPMLLTIQFMLLSNRPEVVIGAALKGSLHPSNFATLGFANIFGSHNDVYWGTGWQTPETEFTDSSFNYMFVGAVPVVLLLWFGLAGGWAFRRGRMLIAAIMALALVFALGRYTPLFALAFDWIPGVHIFRRPVDSNFVFFAALVLMCGWLLADYVREGVPRFARWRWLIAFGLPLAALASALHLAMRTDHLIDSLLAIAKVAPVFAAVILLLAFPKTARARSLAAALVTVIAVGELVWWNASSPLNAEPRANYAVLDKPSEEDALALSILERDLAVRQARGEYPRVEVMGLGGPWQNLAMVRGWQAINGYNPLRIGFYDRFVRPGESNHQSELRDFSSGSFDNYDCALARSLGLGYVVLDRALSRIDKSGQQAAADLLLAGPKVWIYRLKHSRPRVKFSARVLVADADATTANGQLALSPSSDQVLIDDDTPPSRGYGGSTLWSGQANIITMKPGHVEIDVLSSTGGVLTWHGTFYPGWFAEIDGKVAPIMRADVLFRGIEVPSGQHRVVLRYAPFSLRNLTRATQLAWRGHPLSGPLPIDPRRPQ